MSQFILIGPQNKNIGPILFRCYLFVPKRFSMNSKYMRTTFTATRNVGKYFQTLETFKTGK